MNSQPLEDKKDSSPEESKSYRKERQSKLTPIFSFNAL